jgi:hypothetical protein
VPLYSPDKHEFSKVSQNITEARAEVSPSRKVGAGTIRNGKEYKMLKLDSGGLVRDRVGMTEKEEGERGCKIRVEGSSLQ